MSSVTYDPSVNLRTSIPEEDRADKINPDKRNFIIAVPMYHENLYQHIKNNFDWLRESSNHTKKTGIHYRKKVKTPEDLTILNGIINDLRTEKSELFLDFTFHKKPIGLPMREYINEFLRIKGIFSYYTFMGWYRVTVYPESGIEDCPANERCEYIIVPLLIRLKKNKVFDQFKSIHYTNTSGTEYEIRSVNPHHFLKDDDPRSREQEEKMRDRYEVDFKPKYFKEEPQ